MSEASEKPVRNFRNIEVDFRLCELVKGNDNPQKYAVGFLAEVLDGFG
jgi:hypothetical protein